jgi:hypothetical protein
MTEIHTSGTELVEKFLDFESRLVETVKLKKHRTCERLPYPHIFGKLTLVHEVEIKPFGSILYSEVDDASQSLSHLAPRITFGHLGKRSISDHGSNY